MQSDKIDGAKYFHALNFSTLDNKTLNIYLTWRRFQCPSEQLRYQTTAREIDGVVVAVVVLSCWILSIQKDNFQFEWMSMSTMMLRWERCKDILIMLIKGKLLRSVPCQEHWPMKNGVFYAVLNSYVHIIWIECKMSPLIIPEMSWYALCEGK